MYVQTDGRTFETGFIRSTLSKSGPNNELHNSICMQLTDILGSIIINNKNDPYFYFLLQKYLLT